MKQILFFATRADLLTVLESVGSTAPLKYVQCVHVASAKLQEFRSPEDIPSLGVSTSDSAISSDSFLVCGRDQEVHKREIQTPTALSYSVDQINNPDSVVLTPAGIRGDGYILHGRVSSASDSAMSKSLMKRFHAAFKAQFQKVNAFYVGREARLLQHAGRRLTISTQSPREFDLIPVP